MKIGVVIPYNIDRGWLEDAIRSVENQTYADWYLRLEQSDNSAGYNINKGIQKCLEMDCDVIRYLCDDDMLTANSLEDTVRFFHENPDFDFMHSNAITRWEKTGNDEGFIPPVKHPTLKDMVLVNRLHGGTVAYRAKCFSGTRFDEELWTGEEYDLNMKLMKYGFKIGYLDTFTYIYRRHSKQKSLGNMAREYQAKRKEQVDMIRNRYR